METENPIEKPLDTTAGRVGLEPAEQVALQIELLRMAGVRYLSGDPSRLMAQGIPGTQRRAAVQQPMTGNPGGGREAGGTRLADLAKQHQARPQEASNPLETPSTSRPIPPSVPSPTPRTVPLAPTSSSLGGTLPISLPPHEPVAPARAPGSLFALEQAGSGVASLPELDAATRQSMLESLRVEVAACRRCPALVAERTQTVFGVGPVDAELCIVGEAPGFNEDKLGEPFVGDAGQLLNKMLGACGFERHQVYICNILRCRPPANRQPQPDEAQACHPFLVRTLELVRPKFLCLMGASATRYLLDQSTGVGVLRKRDLSWRGIPVQATYHPAYLLRYPDKKRDAWEDLQRMLGRMGRKPPEAT